MKKKIHINQHKIRSNKKNNLEEPTIDELNALATSARLQ